VNFVFDKVNGSFFFNDGKIQIKRLNQNRNGIIDNVSSRCATRFCVSNAKQIEQSEVRFLHKQNVVLAFVQNRIPNQPYDVFFVFVFDMQLQTFGTIAGFFATPTNGVKFDDPFDPITRHFDVFDGQTIDQFVDGNGQFFGVVFNHDSHGIFQSGGFQQMFVFGHVEFFLTVNLDIFDTVFFLGKCQNTDNFRKQFSDGFVVPQIDLIL
jgi:hypothetical protein